MSYKCEICGREYSRNCDLSRHYRTEHNLPKEEYYTKYILKQDEIPKCICGKNRKFISIVKGFNKTCGDDECVLKLGRLDGSIKRGRDKAKKTNIERYGFEHASQSKEIKDKMRETNIERYGVEYSLQSEEIRDKGKETNIERYGFENPAQSKEIKDKIKETNIERYGFENPFQSEEIKDKIKKTNIERYGVENPFQSEEIKDKIKETNIERYGVEYVLKNKDIIQKGKDSHFEKHGVYHHTQIKENMDSILEKNRIKMEANGYWIPLKMKTEWDQYKYLVWQETKNNEYLVESIEKRGKYLYHLDHKYSIKQGFIDGILPCIIGSFYNLEMLHWKENISKNVNCSITKEDLFDLYFRNQPV